MQLTSTDTPGGPVPGIVGSVTVTGAATSADGTAVALRTYTDAYLFPLPDGDVAARFAAKPVRVPLPDEAQGEAIAFEPDGSLLSGSEGAGPPAGHRGGRRGPAGGAETAAGRAETGVRVQRLRAARRPRRGLPAYRRPL